MMDTPKLVTVYLADGRLAGEIVKLLLESFGLTPHVAQESVGMTYGLAFGPMGEVAIMVPESQSEDAKKIIAAWERGDLEGDHTDMRPENYSNKNNAEG